MDGSQPMRVQQGEVGVHPHLPVESSDVISVQSVFSAGCREAEMISAISAEVQMLMNDEPAEAEMRCLDISVLYSACVLLGCGWYHRQGCPTGCVRSVVPDR